MRLAEQFTNLGEEFLGSFDARVNFLGQNIADTHRFLNNCKKDHRAMGKKLRADLGAFTDHLTDTVDQLRHKFRKEQKTVHQQCKESHQAWQRVAKTMAAKRHNFKGTLAKATQSAARSH
jgi:DNA repair ATPase RecN